MRSAGLVTRPVALTTPAMPRKIARKEKLTLLERSFITVKSLSLAGLSKRRRGIDPQHPGFLASRILPPVGNRALKIKTIAGFQPVMLPLVQPDFKISPKHMEKFL